MAGPDHTKPPNLARGIPPLRIHSFVGTALGAGMWFFVSGHGHCLSLRND